MPAAGEARQNGAASAAPAPERDSSQGVDAGEGPDLDRIFADPSAPTLVFQPIVDLRLGVVAGYEALARFGARLADAPYLVFAEANRRGCAAELEARVLRAALAARDRLPARCFLAINVSPHLLASLEVSAVWRGLVLELNDAVAFDGEAALNAALEALRKAGASSSWTMSVRAMRVCGSSPAPALIA